MFTNFVSIITCVFFLNFCNDTSVNGVRLTGHLLNEYVRMDVNMLSCVTFVIDCEDTSKLVPRGNMLFQTYELLLFQ